MPFLHLLPVGGDPCRLREAGEEAQNSRPGAQRPGYHLRHRPEGKHLRRRPSESKCLSWLAEHGRVFQPRCDGKNNTAAAIDRSRVESRPGSTT